MNQMLMRAVRVVVLLWLTCVTAHAVVPVPHRVYVNAASTGEPSTGENWSQAYRSLQQAIAFANANPQYLCQIWIAKGTHYPAAVGNPQTSFVIQGAMELYGGFDGTETDLDQRDIAANPTILSGDLGNNDPIGQRSENSRCILNISTSGRTVVLDGLVIEGGYASGGFPRGAAIKASRCELQVRKCTIHKNQVQYNEFPVGSLGGGSGAGVYLSEGIASFSDCRIANNYTGVSAAAEITAGDGGHGGAVYSTDSSLSFERCMIENNFTASGANSNDEYVPAGSGGSGGAIFAINGVFTMTDSIVRNNRAGDAGTQSNTMGYPGCGGRGGALYLENIAVTVERSVFTGNRSGSGAQSGSYHGEAGHGGAIVVAASPILPLFRECTLSGNDSGNGAPAGIGGAVYSENQIYMQNCMLTGNRCGVSYTPQTDRVSAVYTRQEGIYMNCTIADNGGFAPGDAIKSPLSQTFHNCIVWNNTLGGSSLSVTYSCLQNLILGIGNFSADPLFKNPPVDYRLRPGSPCIDAGLPAPEVDCDFEGQLRNVDGNGVPNVYDFDIGADEWHPNVVTVAALDGNAYETMADKAIFRISRTGSTDEALTVAFCWRGTATKGTDFSAPASPITINAGQSYVDVAIIPKDDAVPEADETITLKLLAGNFYSLGTSAQASATLFDNEDDPVITVSAPDNLAAEPGVDTAKIRFARTGPTTNPLSVSFKWGGTATKGTDYSGPAGVATIPAGQSSVDIKIAAKDDTVNEGNETVIVTLLPQLEYRLGTPKTVTVTIDDDEDNTPLTINAIDSSAVESGANTGTIRISRPAAESTALSVLFRWKGTATKGADYSAISPPVTIPAGASYVDVVIKAKNDGVNEPIETVILELLPSSSYKLPASPSATVNISDRVFAVAKK